MRALLGVLTWTVGALAFAVVAGGVAMHIVNSGWL